MPGRMCPLAARVAALVLAGALGHAVPARARPPAADAEATPAPIIASLRVTGLERTHPSVVERELRVREGEPLDPARLAESAQRLRNLLLFSRVDVVVAPRALDAVAVEIRVVEKWTLIPVVRFGGGGGTQFFVVGLYEFNSFGRYVELGAQYENTDGAHGGLLWFRAPRAGRSVRVDGDLQVVDRTRRLYDAEGALEGGFTVRRRRGMLSSEVEVRPWLTVGGGGELQVDSFDDSGLTDEERAVDRVPQPEAATTVLGRAHVRLGRLDWDSYLVEGGTAALAWEHAGPVTWSDERLDRLTLTLIGAVRLPGTLNLAGRILVGGSTTDAPQHLFWLGGLDSVRGLRDGELRGRHAWLTNLEARVSSVDRSWFALQHIFFFDAGRAGDTPRALWRDAPPWSVGTGVRLLSPRIYRLVLRLDYAFARAAQWRHGVSFGMQQFF